MIPVAGYYEYSNGLLLSKKDVKLVAELGDG